MSQPRAQIIWYANSHAVILKWNRSERLECGKGTVCTALKTDAFVRAKAEKAACLLARPCKDSEAFDIKLKRNRAQQPITRSPEQNLFEISRSLPAPQALWCLLPKLLCISMGLTAQENSPVSCLQNEQQIRLCC